ncbi:MAG: hypothetical protein ABSB74_20890 [Tepidisphaeraceae bacterium]
MRGILSIIVGGIFIVGGLTGKLGSTAAHGGREMVVVGSVIVVIGLMRLARG